ASSPPRRPSDLLRQAAHQLGRLDAGLLTNGITSQRIINVDARARCLGTEKFKTIRIEIPRASLFELLADPVELCPVRSDSQIVDAPDISVYACCFRH